MAAHEPASPASKEVLAATSGYARLTNTRIFTGSTLIGAGVTAFIVSSNTGNATEGRVLALGYEWQADDLQTSPVSLVVFEAQASGGIANPSSARVVMPAFVIPSPPAGWNVPYPAGGQIKRGQGVALQIKNNEDAAFWATGWILVDMWNTDDREQADRDIDADRGASAPWARTGPMLTTGRPQ